MNKNIRAQLSDTFETRGRGAAFIDCANQAAFEQKSADNLPFIVMYYYNINNYQPDVTNHLRVCNNRKCDIIPVLGFQVERSTSSYAVHKFSGFFLFSPQRRSTIFLVQFVSRAFPSYLIESCLGFLGWKTSVLLHRISSMSGMPRVLQVEITRLLHVRAYTHSLASHLSSLYGHLSYFSCLNTDLESVSAIP